MSLSYCIVGAGTWGKNHVRVADELDVLAAVVDADSTILAKVGNNHPNIRCHSSLDDVGALDYDAYSIVVPADQHYPVAKLLIQHHKHVLIEKPMALDLEQSTKLVELAKKNNVVVCVGHIFLFHNGIVRMKELIDEGKIGALCYMYANKLNLGVVRTTENSLLSLAPHDISIFKRLTNESPEKVTCTGSSFLQENIEDSTITVLEYPSEVRAHIFASWFHPFKERRFVAVGSKMLVFEDSAKGGELHFYNKSVDIIKGIPILYEGPTERILYEKGEPLKREIEHFIECIENETHDSLISGEEGLDVMRTLDLAMTSLKLGKTVKSSKNLID